MLISIDKNRLDAVNLKCIAALLSVTRQQVYNYLEQGMPRNDDGSFDWPQCCEWVAERRILKTQGEDKLSAYRERRLRHLLEAVYEFGPKSKTGTRKAWDRQIERLRELVD